MNTDKYTPSQQIIEKYAQVMVNFALGGGKGIKPGDTVFLLGHECSKPLFMECIRQITLSGGQVILNYLPDNTDRFGYGKEVLAIAESKQLEWFPEKYMKGLVDEMDHYLYIICDEDPKAMAGISPEKTMIRQKSMKPFMEWRTEKENLGKLSWTLCLYPSEKVAAEANMTIQEYWEQVIQACFLNEEDPIAKWRSTFDLIDEYRNKLNKISPDIDTLHITGEDADLLLRLGEHREWHAGSGCNIPSFEIFTSPDARFAEGWIKFNQPLYRFGNLIEDVYLKFEGGKVVESSASKGEDLLKEMIATENADKIGEFSLTDSRCSNITKFMAETLFDENVGGPEGNTHIALGNSYTNTCTLDITKMSKAEFEALGYNYSAVHTDIISTTRRKVIANMKDGSEVLIYENGQFVL